MFANSRLALTITECQRQCAHHLARLRTAGHNHCRKAFEDTGSQDRNLRADYFGLLAEIVVIDHIERMGIKPQFTLLSDRPTTAPDITLSLYYDDFQAVDRIEIKSCPPGQQYLCISERQHQSRVCDCYLPVVFESEECLHIFEPIAYQAVDKWELRKGHSAYRSIHISQLQPLADDGEWLIPED